MFIHSADRQRMMSCLDKKTGVRSVCAWFKNGGIMITPRGFCKARSTLFNKCQLFYFNQMLIKVLIVI